MAAETELSDPIRAGVKTRALALLVISPACSIVLMLGLYLGLRASLPENVAIHVGPDGVGYGPLLPMIMIICAAAVLVFAIGGATARGFLRAGHWYQSEKAIAVGIESLGYGVIGVGLFVLLSLLGADPETVSADSVGAGLLGFLLGFIAAACAYTVLLPRARMESLGQA